MPRKTVKKKPARRRTSKQNEIYFLVELDDDNEIIGYNTCRKFGSIKEAEDYADDEEECRLGVCKLLTVSGEVQPRRIEFNPV